MNLTVKTNVAKRVREICKAKGYAVNNIDSSFIPSLEAKVYKVLEEAVERAHKNQRKTLMGRDV